MTRRRLRSFASVAAILIVLWLIWSRLHIVLWVQIPWWGLLIVGVVLFLAVEYVIERITR
jgi:hypothetical protein